MIEVKATQLIVSASYGTIYPGVTLRCSESYAAHLVNELHAAEYVTAPDVETLPTQQDRAEESVIADKKTRKPKSVEADASQSDLSNESVAQ